MSEPTKLAGSLPKNLILEQPLRREKKCEKCKKELPTPKLGYSHSYTLTVNGHMRLCKECDIKAMVEIREKKADSIIPKLFTKARLEHLPLELQQKIKDLPENKGLFLWGNAGVGKSYAMAAMLRSYIVQGDKVARTSYEMICLQIRDTYKAESKKTEMDVIKGLIDVQKLFIEDVGTTVSIGLQETDFSLRTFLVLLDQRLEQCRPTFITTNKSVEELAKSFDARIASRLQQACEIINLKGKDRRKT